MKFADLHTHTVFSDGTKSPEGLVAEAKKQRLDCIAVCDHDTVGAVSQALSFGSKQGVEVLPGIELSTEFEGIEVHLLGYMIDPQNPALKEKLDFLKNNRVHRIYEIVGRLESLGVKLKPESVFDIANGGTPGRLHIARAMLKEKLVNTINEAFVRFIGDRSPAYVCGFRLEPQEAIRLIKQAGGVSVLAHPYSIKRDELIPVLAAAGLSGLEVYYPEHTQSMINFYLNLAQKYNLLVTGGSDYHGAAKPDVKMGVVRIPYELVEKIKERAGHG
ncbi:MAG: PHP domain-containing protein [Candidatus Omnitrophica bacterium]|nr:PHP domain-containing protein [Candidatus Omnitrophota bacterium]